MRDAVIVSTARTLIGRAYRGAFNATPSPTLAAHAIRAAVARSGVDPAEIEDVVLGCSLPQGVQQTVGRTAALRAGLPVTVAGMTIDRQCSSGLMTIATAAKQVVVDRMDIVVAGGVESISMVQTPAVRVEPDPELVAIVPDIYKPMLETAETVPRRYGISRERQDAYAQRSQQLTAKAQDDGAFDDEIVPVTAHMAVTDKATGETSTKEITLTKDEGNRRETTAEGLAALKPVIEGGAITAGNTSQLSDGASACVIMMSELAAERGLAPLGCSLGMRVADIEPDEMGIGRVFAIPELLKRFGLSIDDVGLWELDEAFAVQVLYCQDVLGIPQDKLNVSGGAISIGHPYGMSGARLTGHALIEGKKRNARHVVDNVRRRREGRRWAVRGAVMKALLSTRVGGPATPELTKMPRPTPGPGELRVRVLACAIKHPDTLIMKTAISSSRPDLSHLAARSAVAWKPRQPNDDRQGRRRTLGAMNGSSAMTSGERAELRAAKRLTALLLADAQAEPALGLVPPAGHWSRPDAVT